MSYWNKYINISKIRNGMVLMGTLGVVSSHYLFDSYISKKFKTFCSHMDIDDESVELTSRKKKWKC